MSAKRWVKGFSLSSVLFRNLESHNQRSAFRDIYLEFLQLYSDWFDRVSGTVRGTVRVFKDPPDP